MVRASFAAAQPSRRRTAVVLLAPSNAAGVVAASTAPASASKMPSDPNCAADPSALAAASPPAVPDSAVPADAAAPEVVAVRRRSAAVIELRRGLVASDPSPGVAACNSAPLISALRSLVNDFEDLTDEQTAIIARLKKESAEAKSDGAALQRKVESLKAALRLSVEKSVDASRKTETQSTAIACLEQSVAAGKKAFAEVSTLADERRGSIAALKDRLVAQDIARVHSENISKCQLARISSLEDKLQSSKRSYEGKIEAQNERILHLEAELLRSSKATATAEKHADDQKDQLDALQEKVEVADSALSEARDQLKEQRAEIDARDAELREVASRAEESAQLAVMHSKQISAMQAHIDSLTCSRKEEESSLLDALRERDAAHESLVDANATNESLRQELANLQATCTNYASAIALASRQLATAHSAHDAVGLTTHTTDASTTGAVVEHQFGAVSDAASETYAASDLCVTSVDETSRGNDNSSDAQNILTPSNRNVDIAPTQGAKKSKFHFRVDVPDFKPTGLQLHMNSNSPATTRGDGPFSETAEKPSTKNSYQNLFWCPPGTQTCTLVSTVHKEHPERVQVVEISSRRWADGAALWYDIANALIPDAGCACSPPAEGSSEFWSAIEIAFLSVGSDEGDEAPAPIVFVLRNAGLLAPSMEDPSQGDAYEACVKMAKVVQLLFNIHDSLAADRFSVCVVLEGWPSSVLLGGHVAQSLCLPRVSRRSGKTKRYRTRIQPAMM